MLSTARPSGGIDLVDASLTLARRLPARSLMRALGGGLLLVGAIAFGYVLEEVEGVRTHEARLLIAILVTAAFVARSVWLARTAAEAARLLAGSELEEEGAPTTLSIARTAIFVGIGLTCWLILPVASLAFGVTGLLLVAPMLALRAIAAPSWLARAGLSPEGGFRSYRRAFTDMEGQRVGAAIAESVLIAGASLVVLNLQVTLWGLGLIAQGLLGLDTAAVSLFISPRNGFSLLLVGGVTFCLFEPLRAALSATFVVWGARMRDGQDMRRAIDLAIAHAERPRAHLAARPRAAIRKAALSLALLSLLSGSLPLATQVHAQPDSPSIREERDLQARREAARILERPELRDYDDEKPSRFADLWLRLMHWLLENETPEGDAPAPTPMRFSLPSAEVFLALAGLLLLAVVMYVLFTRRALERGRRAPSRPLDELAWSDVRERAPSSLIDEARALAAKGSLREALRALYLAALVSLDRRRLITFDKARTNWQYLRDMPAGEARAHFAELTTVFDHKWYGEEPTTQEDLERCIALTEALCEEEARA